MNKHTDPGTELDELSLATGPGALLAGRRAEAEVSLEAAAEALHLPPAMIEALERDDYRPFAAPAYARGHLRRYARFLNVPAEEVLKPFSAVESRLDDPVLRGYGRIRARGVRSKSPSTLTIGLMILVLLLTLAGLWFHFSGYLSPQVTTVVDPGAEMTSSYGTTSNPQAALPPIINPPQLPTIQKNDPVAQPARGN